MHLDIATDTRGPDPRHHLYGHETSKLLAVQAAPDTGSKLSSHTGVLGKETPVSCLPSSPLTL